MLRPLYSTLMQLFPRHFDGPINFDEFFGIQEDFTGLAENMASAALLEDANPAKALQLLEGSRAMLNQILFAAATAGSFQSRQVNLPDRLRTDMEQAEGNASIAPRRKQALREGRALLS